MKFIELISRITFIVISVFHFIFNLVIFEINYLQGNYRYIYNINAAGEADFEAVMMIVILFPFLIGLMYFLGDFKKNMIINDGKKDRSKSGLESGGMGRNKTEECRYPNKTKKSNNIIFAK